MQETPHPWLLAQQHKPHHRAPSFLNNAYKQNGGESALNRQLQSVENESLVTLHTVFTLKGAMLIKKL